MKRVLFLLVVLALLVMPATVLAGGPSGPAGKSNMAHLYLYQKDPVSWQFVAGGAWGKLTYKLSGPTFDFAFNGHKLQANTGYSLIYYADPWPGNNPGALIASGTSNADGNIHLAGAVELNTDLPNPLDANYGTINCGDVNTPGNPPLPFPCNGAKIWLVLSSDYNAAAKSLIAWNPATHLYEYKLIRYDDTDIP